MINHITYRWIWNQNQETRTLGLTKFRMSISLPRKLRASQPKKTPARHPRRPPEAPDQPLLGERFGRVRLFMGADDSIVRRAVQTFAAAPAWFDLSDKGTQVGKHYPFSFGNVERAKIFGNTICLSVSLTDLKVYIVRFPGTFPSQAVRRVFCGGQILWVRFVPARCAQSFRWLRHPLVRSFPPHSALRSATALPSSLKVSGGIAASAEPLVGMAGCVFMDNSFSSSSSIQAGRERLLTSPSPSAAQRGDVAWGRRASRVSSSPQTSNAVFV